GRPQRLVFAQMVDYFHRSKKDPKDVNDELLKNTLLKQHRDYIGFIRTQESDILIPIKRDTWINAELEAFSELGNTFTSSHTTISGTPQHTVIFNPPTAQNNTAYQDNK